MYDIENRTQAYIRNKI